MNQLILTVVKQLEMNSIVREITRYLDLPKNRCEWGFRVSLLSLPKTSRSSLRDTGSPDESSLELLVFLLSSSFKSTPGRSCKSTTENNCNEFPSQPLTLFKSLSIFSSRDSRLSTYLISNQTKVALWTARHFTLSPSPASEIHPYKSTGDRMNVENAPWRPLYGYIRALVGCSYYTGFPATGHCHL